MPAALVAAGMLVLAVASSAAADDVGRAKSDAGLGLATVVANVFYVPVKVGYAVVGGVTGGLAYALTAGNKDAAQRVWVSSMGGDYVLTSDMVAGQQKIKFSGTRDPDL
ncbi:MAG TPA: hypothetical protein VIV14_03345 [Gammaproteobacteria bacterium]